MRQFRKGDIVTIECVVLSQFSDDDLKIRHPDGYTDIFIDVENVTLIRHVLEADDLVINTALDGMREARVLAVHDTVVWVEDITGFSTWRVQDCRRILREEAQVAA